MPLDEVETAIRVVNVIQNIELREKIVEYLSSHDYGNEAEVNKIYNLMD